MSRLRHFANTFGRTAAYPTSRRVAASLLGSAVALYAIDGDAVANAKEVLAGLRADAIQRYTVSLDAAPVPTLPVEGASRVDTATNVVHPLTLAPASAPQLALVGVGVRTVSFLRMKVYSAGFYVDDYTLKRLPSLPGWSGYTAEELKGPEATKLVQAVLDAPAACAVNVVPVRNTDFGHLRDGLTRTLANRQKAARRQGDLTPEDEERLAAAFQAFKGVFPAGSVPKGKSLTLVRSADGHLHVEYEGRVLGHVHDKWMADNLMLAYLGDHISPISSPLRDSCAEGFAKYVQ